MRIHASDALVHYSDLLVARSPEIYDVVVHVADVHRSHEVTGRRLDYYTVCVAIKAS